MQQQFTLHANPVCELFGANQISSGDVQSTEWITEYKATNQVSGIPQYYFWSGGISNPLEVIEQITYLLFLKRLDDLAEAEWHVADHRGAGHAIRLQISGL